MSELFRAFVRRVEDAARAASSIAATFSASGRVAVEREVTGALLGLVDQLGKLRRPMSRSGLH